MTISGWEQKQMRWLYQLAGGMRSAGLLRTASLRLSDGIFKANGSKEQRLKQKKEKKEKPFENKAHSSR